MRWYKYNLENNCMKNLGWLCRGVMPWRVAELSVLSLCNLFSPLPLTLPWGSSSRAEKSGSPFRSVQSARLITFEVKTTTSTTKLIMNRVLRVTQKTHHRSPSHLALPEYSCSGKKINKQIVVGSRLVPTAKGFQGYRLGPEVLEKRWSAGQAWEETPGAAIITTKHAIFCFQILPQIWHKNIKIFTQVLQTTVGAINLSTAPTQVWYFQVLGLLFPAGLRSFWAAGAQADGRRGAAAHSQ